MLLPLKIQHSLLFIKGYDITAIAIYGATQRVAASRYPLGIRKTVRSVLKRSSTQINIVIIVVSGRTTGACKEQTFKLSTQGHLYSIWCYLVAHDLAGLTSTASQCDWRRSSVCNPMNPTIANFVGQDEDETGSKARSVSCCCDRVSPQARDRRMVANTRSRV